MLKGGTERSLGTLVLTLMLSAAGCDNQASERTPSAALAGGAPADGKEPEAAPEAAQAQLAPAPEGSSVNAQTCPSVESRYAISIEGDGAVQRFTDGARHVPWSVMACEPDAHTRNGWTVFAACVDGEQPKRSCFWSTRESAAYFDRAGTFWQLDIVSDSVKREGNFYQGELVARARASKSVREPSSKPGRQLELRVRVKVGTDVLVVPEPVLHGEGEL